jgi:hypothetical protein
MAAEFGVSSELITGILGAATKRLAEVLGSGEGRCDVGMRKWLIVERGGSKRW